jgi:hypothetical protein
MVQVTGALELPYILVVAGALYFFVTLCFLGGFPD